MDLHSDGKKRAATVKERSGFGLGQEESSLRRLHAWLKYEGLTGVFIFAVFFMPFGIVFDVLAVAAVAFTPFMIWLLARAGWYRAIVLFVAFVVLPFVLSRLVSDDLSLGRYLLEVTPLAAFYIFNWVLRLIIGEYLSDRQAVRELEFSRRSH